MAPLAENLTDRYYVDYEGLSGKHALMFRFPSTTTFSDATTRIIAIINAMKPLVHTSTVFNGLRYSTFGSNVSFPVTWSNITGTNTTAPTGKAFPQFISWVGRDQQGVRVKWTLHGIVAAADDDYRYVPGESTQADAVRTALSALNPSVVTASGWVPIINNYANLGYNAYFQRKRRKVA